MSILDRVIATITPNKSPEERAEAHARAKAIAPTGSWFAAALDHHELIQAAFDAVKVASDAGARRANQQQLALLLTGHSLAEEAVLYPAMALGDQGFHATEAYTEQSAAKINMAALETLDPMSQDYLDKLDHLCSAVLLHIDQEESSWFPKLMEASDATMEPRLTARYMEEFNRYTSGARAETPTAAAAAALL